MKHARTPTKRFPMLRRQPMPRHCWITMLCRPVGRFYQPDHMTPQRIEHMRIEDVRAYDLPRLFPKPGSFSPVPPKHPRSRWQWRRGPNQKHRPKRSA